MVTNTPVNLWTTIVIFIHITSTTATRAKCIFWTSAHIRRAEKNSFRNV